MYLNPDEARELADELRPAAARVPAPLHVQGRVRLHAAALRRLDLRVPRARHEPLHGLRRRGPTQCRTFPFWRDLVADGRWTDGGARALRGSRPRARRTGPRTSRCACARWSSRTRAEGRAILWSVMSGTTPGARSRTISAIPRACARSSRPERVVLQDEALRVAGRSRAGACSRSAAGRARSRRSSRRQGARVDRDRRIAGGRPRGRPRGEGGGGRSPARVRGRRPAGRGVAAARSLRPRDLRPRAARERGSRGGAARRREAPAPARTPGPGARAPLARPTRSPNSGPLGSLPALLAALRAAGLRLVEAAEPAPPGAPGERPHHLIVSAERTSKRPRNRGTSRKHRLE